MTKIELIVFLIVLTIGVNYAIEQDFPWDTYKQNHRKIYSSTKEDSKRKAIWQNNYNKIKQHNQEADKNVHSYRLGVNQFTDLAVDEFEKNWLGLRLTNSSKSYEAIQNRRPTKSSTRSPQTTTNTNNQINLTGKDWRKLGGVSPVKNQLSCGSCYVNPFRN